LEWLPIVISKRETFAERTEAKLMATRKPRSKRPRNQQYPSKYDDFVLVDELKAKSKGKHNYNI